MSAYGSIRNLAHRIKGTGSFKLGANYAPGVLVQKEAAKKGYAQNLWLHGPEHYVTEVCLSHC